MVAHRIADPRVLRLIRQWLEAGILESDEWHETDRGMPQGAGISPLLANIFLHYGLDLWVHQWRRRHARGRGSIVRYADDFVVGFESVVDARRMMADLKERLAKFGLSLHEDKTRPIEFSRLPALTRRQCGERHPETFTLLGFTHYCGWTRDGRYIVKHTTQSKRLTRKLKALRQEVWRVMHAPLAEQHRWDASVLRGHYGYYAMPHNYRALNGFRQEVRRIWFNCLRRRRQTSRRMSWEMFDALTARFPLRVPQITHPWTARNSMPRVILGKSRVRESRMPGSVRAKAEWLSYSTANPSQCCRPRGSARSSPLISKDDDRACTVGYGRPPVDTRFKKGQSENLSRRRATSVPPEKQLRAHVREHSFRPLVTTAHRSLCPTTMGSESHHAAQSEGFFSKLL